MIFKILLAEDDRNFGDVLKSYLEMHDYDVHLAQDGQEGLLFFQKDKYDLCILDVMMPKMDGFSLAKKIRERNQEIPIIFLTAKTLKSDVVEGFKVGADDYITKPFNSEELLLRVQAILKRSRKAPDPNEKLKEFRLGEYHFNFPHRILSFRGEETHKLSPKEAELLKMFCLTKNDILNRSDALIKIWGEDNYFTARSMDVFITKLRKYLGQDPNLEIENIHGNGFRLIEKPTE